jgi:hypothetical protein
MPSILSRWGQKDADSNTEKVLAGGCTEDSKHDGTIVSTIEKDILEGNCEAVNLTVQSKCVTVFNGGAVAFAESNLRLLIPETDGFVR